MPDNSKIAKYLVSSYAYYHLDATIMPDTEFDKMAAGILKDYDLYAHRHKHLITKEDLEASTLLLAESAYPIIVKECAKRRIKDLTNT